MPELTRQQIKKQDFVDNEIFELIQRLAPSAKIKWDIEIIADIRESIRIQLTNKKKIKSEMRFYPYIKL